MASKHAVAGAVAERRRMRRSTRIAIQGYVFISPWIMGFLLFSVIPTFISLALSFARYDIATPADFIGLNNYRYAFFEDPLFWPSLMRTIYYTSLNVPLGVIGSLLVAILLNQNMKGKSIYRTLFFLPTLTPVVASALLWSWLLHPEVGLFNFALWKLGLPTSGWLSRPRTAIPSLIMMSLWGSVGGNRMIIFLAGLQGVPQELLEAAELDGAGAWQKLWNVTIPSLSPIIFFNLILGVIGSFSVFAISYIGTGGGPAYATWFYMLHLVNQALRYFEMGYASALAWIFFLIMMVFTYLQVSGSRRWVYYAGEVR